MSLVSTSHSFTSVNLQINEEKWGGKVSSHITKSVKPGQNYLQI